MIDLKSNLRLDMQYSRNGVRILGLLGYFHIDSCIRAAGMGETKFNAYYLDLRSFGLRRIPRKILQRLTLRYCPRKRVRQILRPHYEEILPTALSTHYPDLRDSIPEYLPLNMTTADSILRYDTGHISLECRTIQCRVSLNKLAGLEC